ncbi:hypothetical protein LPJ70_003787, partial [Coemansia sp. RSA 2708]
MSAMVRLRSGPKRQTDLVSDTAKLPSSKKAKTRAAQPDPQPPALRTRRAAKTADDTCAALGTRAAKPRARAEPRDAAKPAARKRKLDSEPRAKPDAEAPAANFIMSSPKRKPREALNRISDGNAQAKRRRGEPAGFHTPLLRRSQKVRAQQQAEESRGSTPDSGNTDSGACTPTRRAGGEAQALPPPSPLKTMLLSPMSSLWRRVSGMVMQGASDSEDKPGALESKSKPSDLESERTPATDEAGAPVNSREANSLTAPPMNPSASAYLGGMQLYVPEPADACPETPSKENIPVYADAFAPDGQLGVATITPMTLPGLSDQALASGSALDADLDVSHVSSLTADSDYDAYLAYDDEDEFNPYLFMASLPPIPREHTLRPYALPRKTRSSPPITLVLDLDETLVHCALTKVDNADIVFPVEYNGVNYDVYCRLRPGYREFLERASALFEVVVFTASQQVYADQLLNRIDPERRFIRHRLFRDSCVYVNTNYVKDLGILGRDEAQMLLVDNCPQAFAYQQSNGVPIES